MTEGHHLSCSRTSFALLFGFDLQDLQKTRLHSYDVMGDEEIAFMYDEQYGNVEVGTTHGLIPYYKYLNSLFHMTVDPKFGDSSLIRDMSRNLLVWMSDRKKKGFSVVDFIWQEI